MKILAVSDVESRFIWEHFDPSVFHGIDLMISCGDLKSSYLSYLVTMIPAPLYYVYGNHDGNYAKNPPDGCVCVDGKVIEYKGLKIAGLGGCLGTNPENPYEFTETQMEKRVRRLQSELRRDKKIDIFVSHAPRRGVGDGNDTFHTGFEAFGTIHTVNRPSIHLYGHLHLNGNPANRQGIHQCGDVKAINCTGYRIIEI